MLATLNAYCTLYLYCVFLAGTPIFTPRGTLRARHEWEYYVEREETEIAERINIY